MVTAIWKASLPLKIQFYELKVMYISTGLYVQCGLCTLANTVGPEACTLPPESPPVLSSIMHAMQDSLHLTQSPNIYKCITGANT